MSARRFVVMIRFVRVALGITKRASSPGMPASTSLPYSSSDSSSSVTNISRSSGSASASEPGRQRARHAGDPEGEDDVLDGRAVARLDDLADERLLLVRGDLAGRR